MEVDWDLNAVVRGCNTTTATAAAATTTTTAVTITSAVKDDFDCKSWFSPLSSEQSGHLFTMVDPFEATNAIEELHELYKPFCSKSHEPVSPKSIISSTKPVSTLFKQQRQTPPKQTHGGSLTTTASSHLTSRSKRRKNQLKRVCQVPAEGLSADVWAWRKYGQKPIKGSPYPRGYYRCSSSKGCLARKQVERNRSDPNMFIVTYTAEHNHPAPTHRNSLAGSTRQKPVTPQTVTASDSTKTSSSPSGKPTLSSSSPATSSEEEVAPQSTKTENREIDMAEEEEEDDDFGLSDVGISDDFFKGLEGFASEQRLFDDFPASFELPWTANNAPTAASSI